MTALLGTIGGRALPTLVDDSLLGPTLIMVGLALAILVLGLRSGKSREGAKLRQALGWRFGALLTVGIAIPGTLAIGFALGSEFEVFLSQIVIIELVAGQVLLGLSCIVAPRNRWFGFRTRRTLSSDERWRATNSRWGRRLAVAAPAGLLALMGGDLGIFLALLPTIAVAVWWLFSG